MGWLRIAPLHHQLSTSLAVVLLVSVLALMLFEPSLAHSGASADAQRKCVRPCQPSSWQNRRCRRAWQRVRVRLLVRRGTLRHRYHSLIPTRRLTPESANPRRPHPPTRPSKPTCSLSGPGSQGLPSDPLNCPSSLGTESRGPLPAAAAPSRAFSPRPHGAFEKATRTREQLYLDDRSSLVPVSRRLRRRSIPVGCISLRRAGG
jgi:hypothetical protein